MPIAVKTLEAIEKAFQQDQGATYRGLLRQLMPLAEDAYNTKQESFRSHLGASLLGRDCARELWYSFHWSLSKKFEGKMIRLFNRGHLEEPRMVALLKMIGCEVWQFDENGAQFRVDGHRGHAGGGLDAVIRGCPDVPNEPILGEFKTHNDASFAKLQVDGVIKSKWEHFIQMQTYMGKLKLNYALYVATNKNTDAIHAEIIQFDQTQFDRYQARSAMIIDSKEPPPKINNSPGWYKCKFCDFHTICHGGALPESNCRTCEHSSVEDGGKWKCNSPTVVVSFTTSFIDKETQLRGCPSYLLNKAFTK